MVHHSFAVKRPMLERGRLYFIGIFVQWIFVFLCVAPPLFGSLGRFYYEPSKTSCTIDYWHGNFKNYKAYIIFLVIFAYLIPICTMYGLELPP